MTKIKYCQNCKSKLTSKNSKFCSKCFKYKMKLKICINDKNICNFCKKWDCKSNDKSYQCKNIDYFDNYFDIIDKISDNIDNV